MKSVAPVNQNENQEQPSPISVLEPPFEEDYNATLQTSGDMESGQQRQQLTVNLVNSNLIDKSPPIESVARTLSWDDSSVETATPYPLKSSLISQGSEEEDREWLFFVQMLLSATGLDAGAQSDSSSFRWHSPESPLDPSLRDNYVDLNDKQIMHEAKRKQRRSTCKLVFDFVNAAVMEITGYGSDTNFSAITCGGVHNRLLDGAKPVVVDQVWPRMKEWFSGDVRCVSVDCGDSNSLVVERVVRKEVVGRGWVEHMRLEIDNMGKEIEGTLLEELVQEALVELTGRM